MENYRSKALEEVISRALEWVLVKSELRGGTAGSYRSLALEGGPGRKRAAGGYSKKSLKQST